MRVAILSFLLAFGGSVLAETAANAIAELEPMADKLIQAATATHFAYQRLAELCDTFGPRFSGTENLERAIDWILAEMKRDGLENVRGEEVMVPRWVRGKESVQLLEPRLHKMRMLGLGGSIGTPPEGITAEALVVRSFDELEERAGEARGKIVVFNQPFTVYRETVQIRARGAIEAARAGAVASLVRSVGQFSRQTPHTGNMRYDESVPKIPHAAITSEDAEMLERMQERGQRLVIRLKMEAETLPDAPSRNVIGEIVGREFPDQIVIVSGHIDSWDVGQGAMDDAGGCIAAWEAARLMHKLGLRPRRTVRVVLWTNEENGLRGARSYRERHREQLENHVLAIESDHGPFKPEGFAFTGSELAMNYIQQIGRVLERIEAGHIRKGASGADITQLLSEGVPIMDLLVDGTKYFWYHHTEADTVDKIDPDELNLCAAAMAVMAYMIAEMPERLPR
jgi:carboxypeptidase Q